MNIFKKWTLRKTTLAVVVLWVIAQIVVIIYFWGAPQGSDQGAYIRMAQSCYEKGEWYPMLQDVYTSYIWAPGFINFLILQLRVFGTVNANPIINVLMNVGIVYLVCYLGKHLFSKRTAYIAVIFYCMLYSNLMIVVPAGTEVPFLFLSLMAFCLCLSQRTMWLIMASVLFALANWVRPLVVIFLPVVLVFLFAKRSSWKHYVALLLPMFITVFIIGHLTERKIGYFVYQSTTSGVNLIMTANDKAYGGVSTSLAKDTTNACYIKDVEQYTFAQRDSIRKKRSIEWIKEHPFKYIKLYTMKIGGLYIEDSWSDRPILGGDGFIDKAAHGQKSKSEFVNRVIGMGAKSVVYYILYILFLYSLVTNRKSILTEKGILLLILLLGTGLTCIFAVSPRYHYPFLFAIIIWAAYGVDTYIEKKRLTTETI